MVGFIPFLDGLWSCSLGETLIYNCILMEGREREKPEYRWKRMSNSTALTTGTAGDWYCLVWPLSTVQATNGDEGKTV